MTEKLPRVIITYPMRGITDGRRYIHLASSPELFAAALVGRGTKETPTGTLLFFQLIYLSTLRADRFNPQINLDSQQFELIDSKPSQESPEGKIKLSDQEFLAYLTAVVGGHLTAIIKEQYKIDPSTATIELNVPLENTLDELMNKYAISLNVWDVIHILRSLKN